jgi:hypothetical protein
MKYKERGHYISEKGRFAESAFKFCIEKYFPRSVFNPVSGDEHGFDGNLILQSDASKQNVISIYFQIKHTSKSNSKKRISTTIKNIETLHSLLQHDYPYLAIMDIEECYNNLNPERKEPSIYLINLKHYFNSNPSTNIGKSITISIEKRNILNFFKAQLLSSTIWCHRYSELIEQYINKYLTENGVADSVIKYVGNSDASKYLSLKLPFENPINEMNSIPFFAKRKLNSFFGSLEYMHKAIYLLKTNWDSKREVYTVANETFTGVEVNFFVFLKTFQQYMEQLLHYSRENGISFYRNFVYNNEPNQYRAIHKLYFYYVGLYLLNHYLLINFSNELPNQADYFVLRDKKAIKLTSYLSSEGNYEVSCQSPDIDDIQERILTSIKDIQSVNDSYNEMINFLKLIECEEELLVQKESIPTRDLFPEDNWLFKFPDDYFKQIVGGLK